MGRKYSKVAFWLPGTFWKLYTFGTWKKPEVDNVQQNIIMGCFGGLIVDVCLAVDAILENKQKVLPWLPELQESSSSNLNFSFK